MKASTILFITSAASLILFIPLVFLASYQQHHELPLAHGLTTLSTITGFLFIISGFVALLEYSTKN